MEEQSVSLQCYYCVEHGIVSLPSTRDDRLEEADWRLLSDRAQQTPDRDTILEMRGVEKGEVVDIESGVVESVSDSAAVDDAPSNAVPPDDDNSAVRSE